MTLYPYALGDLIEQPNTYHYSAYHGRDFIAAFDRRAEGRYPHSDRERLLLRASDGSTGDEGGKGGGKCKVTHGFS